MATGKVGRPKADSVKLQLALPKSLGEWVEKKYKATKFCRNRQDFILGILDEQMKKEQGVEQLELGL
jgi:hypothetical protein